MADKKISQLTNLTGANLAENDEFVLVDTSADETKAITFGELKTAFDTGTGFVRVTGDTMTGDLTVPNVVVSGNVDGRDVSVDGTKLDGIEAGADVTDTANVTSAGALMDSELADIAAVKALDQGVATTDDPTFTNTQLAAIAASKAVTAVDVFVYDTSKDSDGGAWRKRTQGTSWYNETLDTATRGSRKEFPAVAVIVAEADKVTIYDGDDPALPMWMVANRLGTETWGDWISFSANADVKAVHFVNGKLAVATGGSSTTRSGLTLADFLSDKAVRYAGPVFNQIIDLGNISERNTLNGIVTVDTNNIVRAICNDVAMTVLPDAPIDPATGLPVPTIAVATAGGVSVIKDDGTVVDLTHTIFGNNNSQFVSFIGKGIIWSSRSNVYGQRLLEIPDADYSSAPDFYYCQGDLPRGNANEILVLNGDFIDYSGNAIGQADGVTSFYENPTVPANGMIAYTTSTYNTGWMNGDIKGAFLADTDDTDLVGSGELVTNGTFDTDSGWTDKLTGSTGGSVVITGGELVTTQGSNSVWMGAAQAINVTNVDLVVLSGNLISKSSAGPVRLGISNTDIETGVPNFGYVDMSVGNNTVTVDVSSLSTAYVVVMDGQSAGENSHIDNISVKLADADRSVNNNGLIVNGTITRTFVDEV